jgi:hypothetical protein
VDWKHIKYISVVVGVILIITLAFVLGISFGVSYEKGSFTEIVIPVLSAMGSWVAGLGALGAVYTSLWLAEQQRKNSGEKLNCIFDVFVFQGVPDDSLCVIVTSNGDKPSNINSITIHSTDSTVAMSIQQFAPSSTALPTYLPYGQQASYLLSSDFKSHINGYVNKHCAGSYKNLTLSVNTTTDSFKVKFGKTVIEHLK